MRISLAMLLAMSGACHEADILHVSSDSAPNEPCDEDLEPSSYCLPSTPAVVITRDANGDGAADIFVLSRSEFITAAMNDGAGGFSLVSFFTGISPPQFNDRLLLCDADDDGRLDVVFDGREFLVDATLWLQPPSGGAWTLERMPEARMGAATCVDVDGDGRGDIVGLRSGNVAGALPGAGSGFVELLEQPVDLPESVLPPRLAAIADISGDVTPDLVVILEDAGSVWVLRGAAELTVYGGRTEHAAGIDRASAIVAADVDDDGVSDVVLAGDIGETSVVAVLASRPEDSGAVDFEHFEPIEIPIAPERLDVADIDGDGIAEIVASALPDDRVFIVDPLEETVREVGLGEIAIAAALGDFDGDTLDDLVVLRTQRDQMQILWNDGAGSFDATLRD
jgi:hypothetical protein